MKSAITTLCLILVLSASAQISKKWTKSQITAATTSGVNSLGSVEKEAIILLNLARLYPAQFALYEVEPFTGSKLYGDLKKSKDKKDLIKELEKMKPLSVLKIADALVADAKCFAEEQGRRGTIGHKRKKCKKHSYDECCFYGFSSGREIVLSLLIDPDLSKHPHRSKLLAKKLTQVGIATASHKEWKTCAVIELAD